MSLCTLGSPTYSAEVEMRNKPERALTLHMYMVIIYDKLSVEMRYKPERALTLLQGNHILNHMANGRNEV